MTDNDPMARERLRTILADRIEYADAANGHQTTADTLAPELLTEFGAMRFEYKVNEHDVPVRRVVAATVWEVDPERKAHGDGGGCSTCGKFHPETCEHGLSFIGCDDCWADAHRDAAEAKRKEPDELLHGVAEAYGPHAFVPQSYKGQQIDACAHFTMVNSHEASQCSAGVDDAIHAQPAATDGQ